METWQALVVGAGAVISLIPLLRSRWQAPRPQVVRATSKDLDDVALEIAQDIRAEVLVQLENKPLAHLSRQSGPFQLDVRVKIIEHPSYIAYITDTGVT